MTKLKKSGPVEMAGIGAKTPKRPASVAKLK
jgi:hypothetical protein